MGHLVVCPSLHSGSWANLPAATVDHAVLGVSLAARVLSCSHAVARDRGEPFGRRTSYRPR